MVSSVHMLTAEDDSRHVPGPGSLPLWNESFWFAFYDPNMEVGLTARVGTYPNQNEGNIYLHIVRQNEIVHSLVDGRAPAPAWEEGRLEMAGYTIDWEEPLERFRLRYQHGNHALDLIWKGISPAFLYPHPPGTTAEQIPRHVEHGGAVSGRITISGRDYEIECLGHRDHSWGGERDWSLLPRWDYLSGEFGEDLWFNAVRVTVGQKGGPETFLGCIWDGSDLLNLTKVEMDVRTSEGGTRQTGVDLRIVDERQQEHHIVGEKVLAIAPTRFQGTWVKDGFTRYRYGERIGYGILECGYIEDE